MKNVVFDFGGVLFRWRPHVLIGRVLPQRAPDEAAARALAARVFGPIWGEFDRGAVPSDEMVVLIAQSAGLPVHEVQALVDGVPEELQPLPATVALLDKLHAHGHPLYFLSNMPEPFIHHVRHARAFFERFRSGVFSSDVKLIKPEAAIYQLADRQFGTDPAHTVFIDDMPANVMAARTHGWQAVRFENALQCEAALRGLGCL